VLPTSPLAAADIRSFFTPLPQIYLQYCARFSETVSAKLATPLLLQLSVNAIIIIHESYLR